MLLFISNADYVPVIPPGPPAPLPPVVYPPTHITQIIPGPMLVRVVRAPIVYMGNVYTQGMELYMPRDTIYEDINYRGFVERVSGYDV